MRKLKYLLTALIAVFVMGVGAIAQAQEEYTEPEANYSQNGKTILFYTQVRQEVNGDNHKHIIHFIYNPKIRDMVYVSHIKCNDSELEGWTKLGPKNAKEWVFDYTDDQSEGHWSWEYRLNSED